MALCDKDNAGRFVFKKCYEIAYAIFRVASSIRSRGLADKMENHAAAILEAGSRGNYLSVKTSLSTSECLLRFCSDAGQLNQLSGERVIGEIRALNAAIAGLPDEQTEPTRVILDDIFSNKYEKPDVEEHERGGVDCGEAVHQYQDGEHHQDGEHRASGNSAIRQSAILERIRQNNNCRLKELQELLPDISERTLRYDVQNLLTQGLIERVGGGGPATCYKAAEQPPRQ